MQTISANKVYGIFSESLMNIDSIFGFCFYHMNHNKQRHHIFYDHDFTQLGVYLQTHVNVYVEIDLHTLV